MKKKNSKTSFKQLAKKTAVARQQIKDGKFYTQEQIMKEFGVD